MKKIYPLSGAALLFLTACLTLLPQAVSTPQATSPSAAPTSSPSPTASPAPYLPPPPRKATPIPKTTPTIEPILQWTFTTPSPADRSIYKEDLAPEYHAILDALPYASLYSIEFIISDDLTRVSGRETVTYFNAEEVELNEIRLRLFPNIMAGKMTVANVAVNQREVATTLALEKSLLILRLGEEIFPGESVVIDMDFEINVAQSLGSHYGAQVYYENALTLAHAYPMLAVYDGEGWNAEIPEDYGDMTYADISFYVVTVEAPAAATLVASGREINREESANRQRVVYAAGPARDFMLAASPEYAVVTKEANGVTLRFYARPSEKSGAAYGLDVAAQALEIFGESYAPYPYRELDFVSTATTAGGIEYPGMIAIAREYIIPGGIYLEAIAAHEVGHQWFYNFVGNDQLDEPWLDESLTQFVTLQYYEATGGANGFRASLEDRWASVGNAETPIGLPVGAYTRGEYGAIVYGRGALFFDALRAEMGAENFNEFMRAYAEGAAWGIATPAYLKEKAEAGCNCDLTALFEKWVYP